MHIPTYKYLFLFDRKRMNVYLKHNHDRGDVYFDSFRQKMLSLPTNKTLTGVILYGRFP